MRRTTFSVVFFCKKSRISKKGKAPIYARITTSGLSTEIYTRSQIEPERWNQRLERSLHRDKTALQINGALDILVNVAGVAPKVRADLLTMTEESYDYVMDINTKGTFFLTQLAATAMIQKESAQKGSIVNISSLSAYFRCIFSLSHRLYRRRGQFQYVYGGRDYQT